MLKKCRILSFQSKNVAVSVHILSGSRFRLIWISRHAVALYNSGDLPSTPPAAAQFWIRFVHSNRDELSTEGTQTDVENTEHNYSSKPPDFCPAKITLEKEKFDPKQRKQGTKFSTVLNIGNKGGGRRSNKKPIWGPYFLPLLAGSGFDPRWGGKRQ